MPEVGEFAGQQTGSKEFLFTGDATAMIAARDRMIDFIRPYCSGEQEEIDIFLALQEALANAVLHGCNSDPSKTIQACVEVDASAITIVIRDPGPGFDLESHAGVTGDQVNLTEHGRGICMMRSLMDEVTYSRGGSQVQLKKLRAVRQ